jgi:hypothetical protein
MLSTRSCSVVRACDASTWTCFVGVLGEGRGGCENAHDAGMGGVAMLGQGWSQSQIATESAS